MYSRFSAAGALALAVSSTVAAQSNSDSVSTSNQIESVLVYGTRLGQAMSEVGSSVSIISAEEIDALGFDFTVDALAAAPGVTVNSNGAFGGQASVRIRGADSQQTLVLLDGVPINDPSSPGGGFNFARFDPENIERIEILRGPHSTLWGTDAIGGVVAITSKRPETGLGGNVFGEYGAFNTFRGGASLSGGGEQGDFRLAVQRTDSDGISRADEDNGNTEDDAYEATTLSAKAGLDLGDSGARLDTNVLWTDASSEFDSFTVGAQGLVSDGDELSETEELVANLSLSGKLLDGRLDNLVVLGYTDIDRQNFSDGQLSNDAEGERILLRYQGTLALSENQSLAVGAEREELEVRDDDSHIDGFFALYEFRPLEALTLTGGLRVDDHSRFGSETTARVAAAFQASDNLTLRASWGEGFKAPTIFQTTYICGFCGLSEANADLQPETSEAYDLGLEWRSVDGRFAAGLTLFDQSSQNLIDFSFTAGYDNIDKVDSRGAEFFTTLQLTGSLRLNLNYSHIDAEDGSGEERARLPEHSGDLTLSYDPVSPFSATLLLRYNGEEANTDGSTLDDWTRVDLNGRWAFSDGLELFARIENLLDEDYQQILGYGTPDRSAYIGARLRF